MSGMSFAGTTEESYRYQHCLIGDRKGETVCARVRHDDVRRAARPSDTRDHLAEHTLAEDRQSRTRRHPGPCEIVKSETDRRKEEGALRLQPINAHRRIDRGNEP